MTDVSERTGATGQYILHRSLCFGRGSVRRPVVEFELVVAERTPRHPKPREAAGPCPSQDGLGAHPKSSGDFASSQEARVSRVGGTPGTDLGRWVRVHALVLGSSSRSMQDIISDGCIMLSIVIDGPNAWLIPTI